MSDSKIAGLKQVKFHKYMNEMTVTEIERFLPFAAWQYGPTKELILVKDLKGRRALVPVEWLAKERKDEPADGIVILSKENHVFQRRDRQSVGDKRWVLCSTTNPGPFTWKQLQDCYPEFR